MKTTIACAGLAMLLIASTGSTTMAADLAVDDGHGREWRQLTETEGLTWNNAAAVCPRDGVSECVGVVAGRDLTGWTWATGPQVKEFLSYYEPAMLTETSVSGFPYFFTASTFLSAMRPTFSFFITYQTAEWTGGWTATTDEVGLPVVAAVSTGTTPVSVGGSFGIGVTTNADESSDRGVFLWRSTGAGTGAPVANDDVGQVLSPAGGQAIADVLVNDWMDGAPATILNVTLSAVSTTNAGVTLDLADGSVDVAPGTAAGFHSLLYRICAIDAPANCSTATARVTVPPSVVNAVGDLGSASPAIASIAVTNVLANDTVDGAGATTATVALTALSSSSPAITLSPSDGSVRVAVGATVGTHTLLYRICERANPTNCDEANVTVLVQRTPIDAVNDNARASSKTGGTAIASVLANDRLGGATATTAKVLLTLVTSPPKGVSLNVSTGAVTVTPKTSLGLYSFGYRICERVDPTNCDQATVTLDLSGRDR